MSIPQQIFDAFNAQINLEIESSLAYEQLAADMEYLNFAGAAKWFAHQAEEEREHAKKFVQHLLDRDQRPSYSVVARAATPAGDLVSAFEASLAHEQKVSNAIRDLYKLAIELGDFDSLPLLQWFIDEQIEEEATVSAILGKLSINAGNGAGLLQIDAELADRA